MNDVTRLLQRIDQGNTSAAAELLPLIYDQLRALAHHKLRHEPAGQTLQGTALVHEAYLKLVGQENGGRWQNRRHFFASAAEAMRRILVDNARMKKSLKRGGDRDRVPLVDAVAPMEGAAPEEILDVSEALEKLAREDPEKAELVKLRYFAGLPLTEAADVLGVSRATASRHWTYAKAWLFEEIFGETE